MPRTPTQAEIGAHEATHMPHEEWCEFCMAGRARNKPHKSKNRTSEGPGEASEVPGAPSGPDAEDVQPGGPVPRICMDYFYVSSGGTDKRGAHGMSTKELQRRLKELGKSNEGQRNVLIKRYEKCVAQEDQEEMGDVEAAGPHASDNPMMVMVDESTGNKYMRAVPHKGVGIEGTIAGW